MAGMRVDRHVLTSLMLENAFTSKNKGRDSRGEGNWKKLGENPVAHSEERVEEEWIINYSSRIAGKERSHSQPPSRIPGFSFCHCRV